MIILFLDSDDELMLDCIQMCLQKYNKLNKNDAEWKIVGIFLSQKWKMRDYMK